MRRGRIRYALGLALALCVSGGLRAVAAQQPFTRGMSLDATAAVRIYSLAGSIRVTGWDRDSIDIRGTIGSGLTPRGGGTRSAFKLSTYDGMQDAQAPSHLEIRVPSRAQLWIKTSTASVRVRDVAGSVELYTIDGAVDAAGAPSELTIESMRGDITVSGTPQWFRGRTGAGTIHFAGTCDDLALSTVSGPIVAASEFARARLESVRGAITLTSTLRKAASLDIDNHSGHVTLTLGQSPSAAILLYTVSGQLINTLSAARAEPSRGTGRELSLETGTAHTRVTVRTFSGEVRVERARKQD